MRTFVSELIITIVFVLTFSQGVFYYYYLDVPEYFSRGEMTKRYQANVESSEMRLVGDWWPPEIGIRSPVVNNNYSSVNVTLSSNEVIADANLPDTWLLYGPQQVAEHYYYLVIIPQVIPGDNTYTLGFADEAGNSISKDMLIVGSSQPLQTPSWPDTDFTLDADNQLSIANKQYQLPQDYEPQDLVDLSSLGILNVNAARLRKSAATALQQMTAAISQAGINYTVTSGYRSFADQVRVYNYWVKYYSGDINATDQVSARPGYSEHQLGLAVDFTTSANGNIFYQFETTPLSKWLATHAHEFGFVMSYPNGKTDITGYSYEPWHYRYIGVGNASQVVESGETLTEWLLSQQDSNQK